MDILTTWIGYTGGIFSSIVNFLIEPPVIYFFVAFLVIDIFALVKAFTR